MAEEMLRALEARLQQLETQAQRADESTAEAQRTLGQAGEVIAQLQARLQKVAAGATAPRRPTQERAQSIIDTRQIASRPTSAGTATPSGEGGCLDGERGRQLECAR